MTRSRRLTCLLTGLAVALGAGAAPAAPGAPAPHRLSVTSHGVTVPARLFTFCRTLTEHGVTGTSLCSDGVPSATSRRLPVHPGGRVVVAVGAPVTSISARYADGPAAAVGALKVRPIGASRRRFGISLPAARPGALLLISTTYRNVPAADGQRDSGDAHFSVGLRRHRHAG